jgi:hypothetical protein
MLMDSNDKYLVQLRRELTRALALLARAERQRDRLERENIALRKLVGVKAAKPKSARRKKAQARPSSSIMRR